MDVNATASLFVSLFFFVFWEFAIYGSKHLSKEKLVEKGYAKYLIPFFGLFFWGLFLIVVAEAYPILKSELLEEQNSIGIKNAAYWAFIYAVSYTALTVCIIPWIYSFKRPKQTVQLFEKTESKPFRQRRLGGWY